jgi:UDP-GlcNAc:undecaprenyl-phosphate GlcNAc-1-phosphate transferase
MSITLIVTLFVLLSVAELSYFEVAERFNIIDKPNHRSSHTVITIRGGGIIFPLSVLLWFFFSGFQYSFFVCGLTLIAFISFGDDVKDVSRGLRVVIHIVAVSLIFYQLHLFSISWLILTLYYVFFIGVINAYNFMDGINGITGAYSLTTIGTLYWINQFQIHFIEKDLLISIGLGLLVFNFFNFRKKAKCFSGDVGSISLALIICFLLCKLIVQSNQGFYILLLVVYGIDSISTIFLRLLKKENIFLAHRQHLYQHLVNQAKYSHLSVALWYAAAQLIINMALIKIINSNVYLYLPLIIVILLTFYILVRNKVVPQTTA